jgi:hypothetical protein
MPVTVMTTIWICHALERFYFPVYMFNHNPPARQSFIISLFPPPQLMVFTRLYRYEAVCMVCFYPKVSGVSVKRYRTADAFPYGVFIYLEIMFAAFGFLRVYDFQAVPLNYDLGLQCMALFFPE